MFSLKAIIIAFAAFAALPLSFARVVNMTAPSTAKAGTNITAVLYTQSYIQNWDDFGVIWGLKSAQTNCSDCVGDRISYDNLFPDTTLGNQTLNVPIPDGMMSGNYFLVAAVPFLVGASGETGINYFNSSISISPSRM